MQNDISDENWENLIEQYSSEASIEAAKHEKAAGEFIEKAQESPIENYPKKPQRILDLHGHTVDEAKREIRHFLQNAQAKKIRTVQVITGRGWHSPNFKAVLPEITEKLLAELKRENLVKQFKKERSGGSFIVYLLA